MSHLTYLQRMGITPWQRRMATPSMLILQAVHVYPLQDHARLVAWLLADAGNDLAAETSLVQAMATATQRQAAGSYHAVWQQSWQDLPGVVIALGARVASALCGKPMQLPEDRGQLLRTPAGQSLVISFSLADLLADASLKALAWQDLKLAMRAMA